MGESARLVVLGPSVRTWAFTAPSSVAAARTVHVRTRRLMRSNLAIMVHPASALGAPRIVLVLPRDRNRALALRGAAQALRGK